MSERDVRKLEEVVCATGDVEWAWRGGGSWAVAAREQRQHEQRAQAQPLDTNKHLINKHGITLGRALTLFRFCQDQQKQVRRPLDQLSRRRPRDAQVNPPYPTLQAALFQASALALVPIPPTG